LDIGVKVFLSERINLDPLESYLGVSARGEAEMETQMWLVGRSPTSTQKSGRLGDITIPGFVSLQEFCSPIRLQHISVC